MKIDSVTTDTMKQAGIITLLPIEEERDVNGLKKMVKFEYFAEITQVKFQMSKSGKDMLKMTFAIDYGTERIYLDQFVLTGEKFGLKQLSKIVDCAKVNADSGLETDDLLGKILVVHIAYEEFEQGQDDTGAPIKVTRNKIAQFVRAPRPEEVGVPAEVSGTPF